MDDVHLVAEAGEVQGVGHGGVAPAHDGHVLAPVEGPVAGGTVGYARAHEPVLVRVAQLSGRGAHAQDHGGGRELVAVDGEGLLPLGELQVGYGPVDDGQVELRRVLFEGRGEGVPVRAAGDAGIVLHPVGLHDLPAGEQLLKELHPGPAPGRVDARRQARGAAADDGNAQFFHVISFPARGPVLTNKYT